MSARDLAARIGEVVGTEHVVAAGPELDEYARDYTEETPRQPGLVVRPIEVSQIQQIVRISRESGSSLTVRVAGSNVGALAIPPEGGVVVDLRRMNRIVRVDRDEMYALIEPGVTWEQLKEHLEREQIPLRLGYPLSPPDTSILANCLLDGLGNLSMRYGSMGEWIGGLEAVLPDGELVRTGAPALSDVWFARGPLPDLTGLFVGWQGTTGIVTKLALQLWPEPPHRQRLFVPVRQRDAAFAAMRELCRTPCCDDVGGLSWPSAKLLLGVDHPAELGADEPEFFLYLDITGSTPTELLLRRALLDELLRRLARSGASLDEPIDVARLAALSPRFAKFAEFPTRLDFLVDHPGGGLTWVGTYGPMGRFERYAAHGVAIMARYGVPPLIVSRPMKGGHFGVMRFIALFDQRDRGQRQEIRRMNGELVDCGVDLGFIPYKTPPWVVQRLAGRLDTGFVRTLASIRDALDPQRLMAPHCWNLGGPVAAGEPKARSGHGS